MKRLNRTEGNLQRIWNDLDNACGLLDNAITELSSMPSISEDLKNKIESFDITEIVGLKNKIEELIEEKKCR